MRRHVAPCTGCMARGSVHGLHASRLLWCKDQRLKRQRAARAQQGKRNALASAMLRQAKHWQGLCKAGPRGSLAPAGGLGAKDVVLAARHLVVLLHAAGGY